MDAVCRVPRRKSCPVEVTALIRDGSSEKYICQGVAERAGSPNTNWHSDREREAEQVRRDGTSSIIIIGPVQDASLG